MLYHFNGSDSHTIGVEIELQLVDAETGELTNSIQQILDQVQGVQVSAPFGRYQTAFEVISVLGRGIGVHPDEMP